MNQLKELLEERKLFLENIISNKKEEISKAPKGIVNVARAGQRVQFYYKNDSKDKKRKYLRKSEISFVKAICQREYDEKVLELAEKEAARLRQLLALHEAGICEDIYAKIKEERKRYISPIAISDEEYVSQWLDTEYSSKGIAEDYPEYYTDNGERVRSKSEILIANALKKHGIPYRYEAPLNVKGFGIIYPDFTVLNVRTRKEYFWEHLGKMDDPAYAEGALQRIELYEKNSIFPGDKLILSHETLMRPLNTSNVEKMIALYLK